MSVNLPALTNQEDTFALAVIEFGGNLGAAYRSVFGEDVRSPVKKAQELICRPEIALRIKQISDMTQEHALISLGSHLVKLAEIRDTALVLEQTKVALEAEKARGEVAGFYRKTVEADQGNKQPHVSITFNTPVAGSVQDWAAAHGKAPVVIEMKGN